MIYPSFPLTALRLRFVCEVLTPLCLGGLRAGSNLRGALVSVMRRATCTLSTIPFPQRETLDPQHVATCPVCWLVAANERPGQERRGYVLTPPQVTSEAFQPGQIFTFHLTLFGEAGRYLPYFVLAVPEVGHVGVGVGRGKFALHSIFAEHPLSSAWSVLRPGENVVRPPSQFITHADLQQAAEQHLSTWEKGIYRLRLDFITPLRLIVDGHLLKTPDFGALFNHLLKRLDDLVVQHTRGSPIPYKERQHLLQSANRVRLVKDQTQWCDLSSGSTRSGQRTWISGLVGNAWYSAPLLVWRDLLPWLLWGEIAQVGKDTVKGNGVFRISKEANA